VKRVRKATAFRGRTDKTVLPYKSLEHTTLENVPGEHFQINNISLIKIKKSPYWVGSTVIQGL
jgi:hypothetical protein